MKESFGTTVMYLVVGILLAFLINLGLGFALSTDMPVVAVMSNSMVPTFYKGDMLVLKGVSPDQIRVGDIVVFSPSDYSVPIVHRVVSINPDGTITTKGDANPSSLPIERNIDPNKLHGKVILIIPYFGWVKILAIEYLIPNMSLVVIALFFIGAIYYFKNWRG